MLTSSIYFSYFPTAVPVSFGLSETIELVAGRTKPVLDQLELFDLLRILCPSIMPSNLGTERKEVPLAVAKSGLSVPRDEFDVRGASRDKRMPRGLGRGWVSPCFDMVCLR